MEVILGGNCGNGNRAIVHGDAIRKTRSHQPWGIDESALNYGCVAASPGV